MEGLFFTDCFWTVFITLQPALSPACKHSSSLTLLFSLCHSFPVFICLSVFFSFCLFQQPLSLAFFPSISLSSVCVWGGCKLCCFKYRLGAFYTITHFCVCMWVFERETPTEREREMKNDAVWVCLNQRCVFGPRQWFLPNGSCPKKGSQVCSDQVLAGLHGLLTPAVSFSYTIWTQQHRSLMTAIQH